MKKVIVMLSALFVICLAGSVSAQYGEKFTKDQADSTIAVRHSQISSLESELKATNDAIAKANADIQQRMADNTKCLDDLCQ